MTPGGSIIASQRFTGEFANQWYTYNYDVRGSVKSILSPTGTLTKEYTYDSFGNATSRGSGSFSNEVQFTGAIADGGGVYYMNARYYNAPRAGCLSQALSGAEFICASPHGRGRDKAQEYRPVFSAGYAFRQCVGAVDAAPVYVLRQ